MLAEQPRAGTAHPAGDDRELAVLPVGEPPGRPVGRVERGPDVDGYALFVAEQREAGMREGEVRVGPDGGAQRRVGAGLDPEKAAERDVVELRAGRGGGQGQP